jgi:predicted dinucleotide-binding enzyme
MGDSLGPKLSGIGYRVIYGSRDPNRQSVQDLVSRTGNNASATSQQEAAQAADIILLAVPWPPMEHVAQNLGELSGKIVIDTSFPYRQAEDGYPELMVATSSAEMIQSWNPGARVVKWSLPTALYIDEPSRLGQRPTNFIASDDREAKEIVAKISAAIGQDPIDAGPLRMSRDIDGLINLFMVPLYQRRSENWELFIRRSSFWACHWQDNWSVPVADSGNLAQFPEPDQPPVPCSDHPDWD